VGAIWPPIGILTFNPFRVPLLNTIILLSSGISITWSHHRIIQNEYLNILKSLFITISLGIYFTVLQGIEYFEATFRIADSIFGASFFITTGFHGIHVIVGTSFLLVCFLRAFKGAFRKYHHLGFEAASWYWHFVDVVWLFLFVIIYWWGGIN
jgi:cytochrome c oxidase subunit 3